MLLIVGSNQLFSTYQVVEVTMKTPLIYLNEYGPSEAELEIIDNMDSYPPDTKFKQGDIAFLKSPPPWLRWEMAGPKWAHFGIPQVWQVRFVISTFQFEMHRMVHEHAEMGLGLDQAHNFLEEGPGSLPRHHYRNPIVYAHAFPHGYYPNTCHWFPERVLKRLVLRAPTENWEPILDEFNTPFTGYDPTRFNAGFVLDMAPDRYDIAQDLQRPLTAEEGSFHSACLLGLEQHMVNPMLNPVEIDPEEECFLD